MNIDRMQEGRRRARAERDRQSIERVIAFQRWLKAGSVLRDIPAIPSDADWRVARGVRNS